MADSDVPAALQGASNFRDLGGLVGAQGRTLRPGMVFRSDHLGALTQQDQHRLQQWGVTHRIDFRGAEECATTPSHVPGLQLLSLPIEPTVIARIKQFVDAGNSPTTAQTVEMMCQTYRDFVRQHGATFGLFLRHLLNHPTPQVFHCTAGKDRTGFAAALLLSALGVARADIAHNYLLTNVFYHRTHTQEGVLSSEVRAILWLVQPEFLQAAWHEIDSHHGHVGNYLLGPVGLTAQEIAGLQAHLLR